MEPGDHKSSYLLAQEIELDRIGQSQIKDGNIFAIQGDSKNASFIEQTRDIQIRLLKNNSKAHCL